MNEKYLELENIVDTVASLVKSVQSEDSKIRLLNHEIDKFNTKTITLRGGLNGNGKWSNYLTGIKTVFDTLSDNGFDVWVIDIENDCLDDIFYVKIGIEKKANE